MYPVIDSHIHLDFYQPRDLELLIHDLTTYQVEMVIAVSTHYDSSLINLNLAQAHAAIKPAFGYHPEQVLPSETDIEKLLQIMINQKDEIVAIGEVGLPYYTRKKQPQLQFEPYIELLEMFLKLGKELDKPIILHAVYEDAKLACDLLEKHSIKQAHFHWFKGDPKTVQRMIENGYFVSFTPDLLYEEEIRQLAKHYPIKQIMVETDGPWPFKGPFQDQLTHPKMLHPIIEELAKIKKLEVREVYQTVYQNTKQFYRV